MKALFFSELRKGRFLPLFGLSLGVLVTILRGVFTPVISDEFLFALVTLASMVLAILGGAGLFASEVERGTLLVLLGLPLSRRRIWLTKVLAGLSLAVEATALLLVPSFLVLPEVVGDPNFDRAVLSGALAWMAVFSVSVLFSTLLENLIAAIMTAALFSFVPFMLSMMMIRTWGASLTGNQFIDGSLWALALVPGLLLGSLFAFSRGEVLRSRRKWSFGAGVFVLSAGVTLAVIVGGFRWATRYDRTRVGLVYPLGLFSNGTIASLQAMRVGERWETRPTGERISRRDLNVESRTRRLLLLDLRTGRELIVRRGTGVAAVSSDGCLAALVTEPFALTWRTEHSWYTPNIEIRNLDTGRLLYRGWPSEFPPYRNISPSQERVELAAWSPDAAWLALQGSSWSDALLLMRPDGSHPRVVTLWPHCEPQVESFDRRWDWDPSGKAVYALTADGPSDRRSRDRLGRRRLIRYVLPRGATNDVWNLGSAIQLPSGYDWWTGYVSVSPDGRSVLVGLIAVLYQSTATGRRPMLGWNDAAILFAFLVPTNGEQPFLLSRTAVSANRFGYTPLGGGYSPGFTWSKDGQRLYYWMDPPGVSGSPELHVWRRGERQAAALQWFGPEGAAASPKNGDLLIGGDSVLLAGKHGHVRTYLNASASVPHLAHQKRYLRVLGLDAQGRAIVCDGPLSTMLGAVNLSTGEFKQVYP